MIKDDHQDYHAPQVPPWRAKIGSHSAIGHQVLEDEVHFISILKAPKMKNQHHFCAKERRYNRFECEASCVLRNA